MDNIKKIFKKTLKWFKDLIPMLLWILLLISILKELSIFTYLNYYLNNNFISILIADVFGSISAWNAINAYIIANSFWNINEDILIITVFLISWITVWFIQIPVEISFFWKRFTIIRNIISFIFAIIWAYLIYFLMNI